MNELCEPRLLAWLMKQTQANPHGILPIGIAAQIVGCTRQGIRHACTRGKMRLLAWRWKPRRLYFVAVLDLLQWQAQRPGNTLKTYGAWNRYLTSAMAVATSDLQRVGAYVVCTKCHRTKSAKQLKIEAAGEKCAK